jgi:hypothetical protein
MSQVILALKSKRQREGEILSPTDSGPLGAPERIAPAGGGQEDFQAQAIDAQRGRTGIFDQHLNLPGILPQAGKKQARWIGVALQRGGLQAQLHAGDFLAVMAQREQGRGETNELVHALISNPKRRAAFS